NEASFDVLKFASLNGLFDLAEIGVISVEDNAVGRMLVHQFDQFVDAALVQIQFSRDLDYFESAVQIRAHPVGIFPRSDEKDAALELELGEFAVKSGAKQFFAEVNENEADHAEKDNDETRERVHAEKEHHKDDAEGHKGAALQKQPGGHATRRRKRSLIEALDVQHQRRARQAGNVEPGEFFPVSELVRGKNGQPMTGNQHVDCDPAHGNFRAGLGAAGLANGRGSDKQFVAVRWRNGETFEFHLIDPPPIARQGIVRLMNARAVRTHQSGGQLR